MEPSQIYLGALINRARELDVRNALGFFLEKIDTPSLKETLLAKLIAILSNPFLGEDNRMFLVTSLHNWRGYGSSPPDFQKRVDLVASELSITGQSDQCTTSLVSKSTPPVEPVERFIFSNEHAESAESLINKFKARRWLPAIETTLSFPGEKISVTVPGYEYTVAQHEQDKQTLLRIVEENNKLFQGKFGVVAETMAGIAQKADDPTGTRLFQRADLHSDLRTLISELDLFVEPGLELLDKHYHCKQGFKMAFLGDITDRGYNDIEILSVLLKLRMEQPDSVYLARGNHESIPTQCLYSTEADWFVKHADLFTQCYKTFPLAVFIADKNGFAKKGKTPRREYGAFYHGLLSPQFDPIPFLEKEAPSTLIPKEPPPSDRLAALAQGKGTQKQLIAAKWVRLANRIGQEILRAQGRSLQEDILWGSPKGGEEPPTPSPRGSGTELSIPYIHAFFQTGSDIACVKYGVGAHLHSASQFSVRGKKGMKVIAEAGAVAMGNYYGADQDDDFQHTQGSLIIIAPRVREWRKTPVLFVNGRFSIGSRSVGMYEDMTNAIPDQIEFPP